MIARATFIRNIDALPSVFDFTRKFAATHQLAAGLVYSLDLVVEELFTNIVKYGSGGPSEVDITLDVSDGHVVIEIVDENAEPFDVTQAGDVDTEAGLDERTEGGLGIHLVRNIMDEVEYEHRDGRARITLRKRVEGTDV